MPLPVMQSEVTATTNDETKKSLSDATETQTSSTPNKATDIIKQQAKLRFNRAATWNNNYYAFQRKKTSLTAGAISFRHAKTLLKDALLSENEVH